LIPAPGTLTPPALATPPNTVADEPKRETGHDLIAEAIRETMPAEEKEKAPAHVESAPAHTEPPPAIHSGWMIQVGAFDAEQEARDRTNVVQAKAGQMLKNANPFTEAVTAGEKTLYRARFAGIQKDQAEAVCKQLKRNDIACMTIKN